MYISLILKRGKTMKKVLCVLFVCLFLLCSCSSTNIDKTNDSDLKISDAARKAAKETIKYIDDFANFNITADKAKSGIENISNNFVETADDDNQIGMLIDLCGYYVGDFVDNIYVDLGLNKLQATNRLIAKRNELAFNSGNDLYIIKHSNSKNKKYSLAELCINRNLIKFNFITTTLSTKSFTKNSNVYSCSYKLKDDKLLFMHLYPFGFCDDIKTNDYITVSGIFDYLKDDDTVTLYLYAVDNSFIDDNLNKELYFDVTKYTSEQLLYDIIE